DLAARRRQRLFRLVESRGAARLDELSTALGVSQATVRRDLNAVSAAGRLRRVHGGAVATDQRIDEAHFEGEGGRATARAIVGPLTRHLLEDLHVDRAVMGTFALSLDEGLTTTDPAEAYTKQLVLSRAREVILLADSTKIGTRSFAPPGG